jgi:hypothetical protein
MLLSFVHDIGQFYLNCPPRHLVTDYLESISHNATSPAGDS